MNAPHTCPQCGTPLTPDAPAGLCPRCLMARGAATSGKADSPRSKRFVPPGPVELSAQFSDVDALELLGAGGMGAVYKARQTKLARLVALKILPPEVGADPSFAERFTREARALAKLNHPNIVAVYDFGQTDAGLYYILMEFVEGTNLRQIMGKAEPREKGDSEAETEPYVAQPSQRAEEANDRDSSPGSKSLYPSAALAIIGQICDALQYAHDQGVVHRDIKPENILIDTLGRVKIADFGLAKLARDAENPELTLTRMHQVMGTPHYMAPEQMAGSSAVDHRADIYSLGVVFYELLTGELPLGRFDPPSKKIQLDVRLDEVVLRALQVKPEQRYQSASEVRTQLETIAHGDATPAGPPAAPAKPVHAKTAPPLSIKALWAMNVALLYVAFAVGFCIVGGLWAQDLVSYDFRINAAPMLAVGSGLAAIAGTILGIMGLNDVRTVDQPRGGLAMALAGVMILPLTAANALIYAFVWAGVLAINFRFIGWTAVAIALLICPPLWLLADFLLFQGAWKLALRLPPRQVKPAKAVVQDGKRGLSWKALIGVVLALPMLLIAAVVCFETFTSHDFDFYVGLFITSPLAVVACLLGGLAIRDIVRSGQFAWDVVPAVAATLALPLVAINAVLILFAFGVGGAAADVVMESGDSTGEISISELNRQASRRERLTRNIAAVIAVPLCLLIDWLIILRTWRAVTEATLGYRTGKMHPTHPPPAK